jgi:hypothetical protein
MTLNISKLLAKTNVDGTCITPTKIEQLCENLLDSSIVGGITYITQLVGSASTGHVDLNAAGFLIGFGLAFLIKLKEYRKIA